MKLLLDDIVATLDESSRLKVTEDLQVIHADNVAEFFYTGDEKADWTYKGFPNLAPPFDHFWIEYPLPELLNINGRMQPSGLGGLGRIGFEWRAMDASTFRHNHRTEYGLDTVVQTPHARWILAANVFARPGTVGLLIAVDGEGHGVQSASGDNLFLMVQPGLEPWARILTQHFVTIVGPVFLTLSLMHCRNVERVPKISSPKRSRGAYRNQSRFTYHTLNIAPMRRVLETEGQSQTLGMQRALHICRGHFATYTDRPLFGKYRGTFWVPMHVRGAVEAGRATKDYNVKPQ